MMTGLISGLVTRWQGWVTNEGASRTDMTPADTLNEELVGAFLPEERVGVSRLLGLGKAGG